MGKQKMPTPQELHRARKQREEDERVALLPPGLVNHGNTCFMNSVLQGLIATRLLYDLVLFNPLQPSANYPSYYYTPIESRRSPQLTNGHGVGGKDERQRVAGMPLGDVFLRVMRKAWTVQHRRQRESLSPKQILSALGQKYEQYLDFAQQDAHEFLRQLLDAMRMEEFDVIRKQKHHILPTQKRSLHTRFPASMDSPSPPARLRRSTVSSGSLSLPTSFSAPQIRGPVLSRVPERRSSLSARPSLWNHEPTSFSAPQTRGPSVTRPERRFSVSARPLLSNHDTRPYTLPPDQPDSAFTPSSFADMIFGGKLTSILVCQKCKHISQTYEDFNDLSLSLSYDPKETKRARLRNLAKKLIPTNIDIQRIGVGMGFEGFRSNSVPPSPKREEGPWTAPEDGGGGGRASESDDLRRRSLDIVDIGKEEKGVIAGSGLGIDIGVDDRRSVMTEATAVTKPSLDGDGEISDRKKREASSLDHHRIEFVEPELKKEKKDKDDSWTKLSRRFSMTVQFGMGGKEKEKSRERKSRSRERRGVTKDKENEEVPASSSASDIGHSTSDPDETLSQSNSFLNNLNPQIVAPQPKVPSPVLPVSPSPSLRLPVLQRGSTYHPHIPSPIPKSNHSRKPSAQETAYLRKILADIVPTSASSNPFGPLFHKQQQQPPGTSNLLWMKMAGIEECLRMFTAVEVLEGENMVGCRMCWKMANGVYAKGSKERDVDDSDDDEVPEKEVKTPVDTSLPTPTPPIRPASVPMASWSTNVSSVSSDSASSLVDSGRLSMTSIPTSLASTLSSGIPALTSVRAPYIDIPPNTPPVPTYGGQPIPLISTTAPLSPPSAFSLKSTSDIPPSSSTNSLSPNQKVRSGHRRSAIFLDTTDESSEGGDSDASASTTMLSDNASSASVGPSTVPRDRHSKKPPPHTSTPRIPRSKQVIMRSAYKRYLIASPPPILVIHLKRFQQLAKAPVMSFSNGFKKLDDYVMFPEVLDLKPFLAPRKEDFGLVNKRKDWAGRGSQFVNSRGKEQEKCVYRLYAVVVHIGNILGGHYVAYTAIPDPMFNDTNPASPASLSRPRKWAYISDTVVRLTTLEEVLKAKAYICMYERI